MRLWQALSRAIDRSDVLVILGLGLISAGFWSVFPPASFLVPGAVLVWYGLPTRPRFVDRDRRS